MTGDLVPRYQPMSRGGVSRWTPEETGAPYRTVLIDFPAMKAPDYLVIDPMGKVPAIHHGDAVVTEAAAIRACPADAFPDASLAPPLSARAEYYRWLFFVAGPLETAIFNNAIGVVLSPERAAMVSLKQS